MCEPIQGLCRLADGSHHLLLLGQSFVISFREILCQGTFFCLFRASYLISLKKVNFKFFFELNLFMGYLNDSNRKYTLLFFLQFEDYLFFKLSYICLKVSVILSFELISLLHWILTLLSLKLINPQEIQLFKYQYQFSIFKYNIHFKQKIFLTSLNDYFYESHKCMKT